MMTFLVEKRHKTINQGVSGRTKNSMRKRYKKSVFPKNGKMRTNAIYYLLFIMQCRYKYNLYLCLDKIEFQ
jgi:hypothetical protein